MKKILTLLLALAMLLALAACSSAAPEEPPPEPAPAVEPEPTPEPVPEPEASVAARVGISLPAEDLQRWVSDGAIMEQTLRDDGCEVDLQYAANDVNMQISQLETMIEGGAAVLVIAAVDGNALGTVLEQAREKGVAVIAYDRLIMDSGAVSYFVTFDNTLAGVLQGQYIVDALDLANAGDKTYNIEFVAGNPADDDGAMQAYNGAMSVLQPYLASGVLVCPSGQTELADVATEGGDAKRAQERFENILKTFYADKPLDAVMASNDSLAQGVAAALKTSDQNDIYPILTGRDCDIVSVKNIIAGKQAMSVYKETHDLAEKTAAMVQAILAGDEPEVNDTESYDNGVITVPAYLCAPRVCTAENYKELLVDSGYYTEAALSR